MKTPNWSVAIKMYEHTHIRVNRELIKVCLVLIMKTPNWSVAIKMYKHTHIRVKRSLSRFIPACFVLEKPLRYEMY